MKRTQLLSILFLSMLIFPLVPQFFLTGANNDTKSASVSELEHPYSTSPSLASFSSQPTLYQPSPSQSQLYEPDPVVPEVPKHQTGSGAARITQLTWNISQTFPNRNDITDYQVHIDEGMMYHDESYFSRIGNKSAHKTAIFAEDWNPLDGWNLYWQMGSMADPEQVTFMSFNISGQNPCEVTEFAIYLYSPAGGPRSFGIVQFSIYAAEANSTSGHGTRPDLAMQLMPWTAQMVDVPNNFEQWVSLPTAFPVLLDSAFTYANTFYFAIRMTPGALINWVCMDDTGDLFLSDGEDDGDAWDANPWPKLIFLDDPYILPPSIDLFLVAAINRFPYPGEIGMMVNGTPVFDLPPNPGTGLWDGGWHLPAINMTKADRYYDVSYIIPGLTYDVTWLGWFYENVYAESTFTAWTSRDVVDWNVTFVADFPAGASDRSIRVSIEADWTVLGVTVNGLNHLLWSLYYSPISGWWVDIANARDGVWTILCESPDYMVDSEILNMSGSVITQANGSDTVTARGYVEDQAGENATNGFGYIIVYDPRDKYNAMNSSLLQMPPGGVAEINWSIWWTSTWAGVYSLLILWSNGTEVGMNLQTLEVYMQTYLYVSYEFPPAGEPVIRGDVVHIEVYYHNQYGFPIDDALVTVINDTSGLEWGLGPGDTTIDYEWINWASQGFPGYYSAFLSTDNASIGVLHNITMYLASPYNQGQSASKQFEVKSRATHIVFFWEGQPLPGLNNISEYWFTSPHPYINDTSLQFTIRYTDDFGLPITGAQLTPYLVHQSQGVYKRLDWIDLYLMDSTKPGFYNITVDTNPILGKAFHEGDPAYIIIHASKFGYESTWSDDIDVQPQPRPSIIDVPLEFLDIVLYQDWQYPTIEHPTILRVVLRDALNYEDLSHGIVKAGVNGGENTTLTLATPGLGLYEISSLSTEGLTPGTYNVTIYAEASDFVNSINTIVLTILPKDTIGYNVESNFDDLQIPNHGLEWWMNLQLYLENTSSPMVSLSFSASGRQPGMAFLPQGTEVILTITAQGGNYDPIIGIVGSDGWIQFEGALTHEGEHQFYISLEGAENYAAITNMEITPTSQSVYVMSMTSIIAQNLPMILMITAIIIIVPLGSVLAYRRYIFLPKRQLKLAKYQAIADTFSDVANLNRLLVLHKESGICVFDPFAEESQDATLVAGFLQAISTFGHDLADSPGLTNGDKGEATTLRELQYEGFRILINDGRFVRIALVLSGTPSDQLRERLEAFTGAFETRYKGDFEHWEGRVDQFNSASDLVEEVFLISLRHPHSVAARKPRGAQLTSIESDIYKLSKELTKDREYIFLGQILSTYLAAAKTNKLEALMSIYQLRMKGVFKAIQLPPMPPPDKSAA